MKVTCAYSSRLSDRGNEHYIALKRSASEFFVVKIAYNYYINSAACSASVTSALATICALAGEQCVQVGEAVCGIRIPTAKRCMSHALVLSSLLICGDIEPNPGPVSHPDYRQPALRC